MPDPDALMRWMPRSLWLAWLEWMKIRGPIGGVRQDYYTSFLAMHAGKPYTTEVSLSDFAMPWVKPDQHDDED